MEKLNFLNTASQSFSAYFAISVTRGVFEF